jgi:hypothetical protein
MAGILGLKSFNSKTIYIGDPQILFHKKNFKNSKKFKKNSIKPKKMYYEQYIYIIWKILDQTIKFWINNDRWQAF